MEDYCAIARMLHLARAKNEYLYYLVRERHVNSPINNGPLINQKLQSSRLYADFARKQDKHLFIRQSLDINMRPKL